MSNIPQVKLGIVAVSRDCFPITLSEMRRANIVKAYGEDIYECPVTVENELDMLKAVEDVKNAENQIVDCEYFTTSLFDLTQPVSTPVKAHDSFMIVICVGGNGTLTDSEGNTVTLRQGETVLVPACTEEVTFSPSGSMKLLTSYIR